MDLPNEVVLLILKSLGKSDLKSARLVSKTWTAFAAEYLFDQAYVSAHPENLEVFRAITRHRLLSKCVKRLKYDAVDFVETLSERRYFRDLWRQTFFNSHCAGKKSLEALTSDPEIKTWLNLVATNNLGPSDVNGHYKVVRKKCKDFRFISGGFHKYKLYAALQSSQFHGGNFFETLVEGLQKLQNLARITMTACWPSRLELNSASVRFVLKEPSGSPLARSWELFHLLPQKREWMQLASESTATDGAIHHWTVINALIRSQRKIQAFSESCYSTPPYVFDRSQPNSLSSHGLDIVAFSGLKILKLHIAAYGDENTPELFPNMDGLRLLLGSLPFLEKLMLDLPENPRDEPLLYDYNQVFPPNGHWSRLTKLSLSHLASAAADFINLLTRRAPILVGLDLGAINLLSGTWEGVIECMKQSMHLTRVNLPDSDLWHRGGTNFYETEGYPDTLDIEQYVLHGGRHPCLRPEQPNSAADDYVTEDLELFYKAAP